MTSRKSKALYYALIQELASTYPISLLCFVSGVSRSGYYKWMIRQGRQTERQQENERVKELILQCQTRVKRVYGYYRVQAWLQHTQGLRVNHKRVYRLMKELNIQAVIRKKKRYFGKQQEQKVVSSNVMNREFTASRPNEKWTTDITYLMFNGKRLYLSVMYDLFNNEVITYQIGKQNNLKLVLDTVKEAIKKRKVDGTILHSDQGFQYTSRQYHELLKAHHLTPSMSRKGNCLDNACMENFFSHFKTEMMYLHDFQEEQEVIDATHQYIMFYNQERIQIKLQNLSPVQYRTQVCA
ncbi:IS3 family transposase [Ectobacillus funiculus]|uniref:IS3 family transposase n=1 Tax=Ectobacillus funiculus TaxID=137993 RepID=UPI0013EE24F7|nr:IS3 family transposase [Ectobacillus funiculus]